MGRQMIVLIDREVWKKSAGLLRQIVQSSADLFQLGLQGPC
jgi:hypothetical protein